MKFYAFLLIVLLTGCSKNMDASAPVAVSSKFYDALMINDIKSARQFIFDKENLLDDGTTSFSFDKYNFSKITIDNNQAFITTSLENKGKVSNYSTVLTKANGKWEILIKKTMINMFTKAIQDRDVSIKITDITTENK